jgi:hypothetical protein
MRWVVYSKVDETTRSREAYTVLRYTRTIVRSCTYIYLYSPFYKTCNISLVDKRVLSIDARQRKIYASVSIFDLLIHESKLVGTARRNKDPAFIQYAAHRTCSQDGATADPSGCRLPPCGRTGHNRLSDGPHLDRERSLVRVANGMDSAVRPLEGPVGSVRAHCAVGLRCR